MDALKFQKLVVFAGGKGSRLGSLGSAVPKPATLINGAPLISYLIDWAREQGFSEVIVLGGHLHEVLTSNIQAHYKHSVYVTDANTVILDLANDFKVTIRDTGPHSQTGCRLSKVRDLLDNDYAFMLTYGDTLTNMKAKDVIHTALRADKLVCLTAGYPDARYGEIVIENGLVKKFKEKERPKFLINRGFFVLQKHIFNLLSDDETLSFEEDVLPRLVSQNMVAAHSSDSWFFSVDTEVDAAKLAKHLHENSKDTR